MAAMAPLLPVCYVAQPCQHMEQPSCMRLELVTQWNGHDNSTQACGCKRWRIFMSFAHNCMQMIMSKAQHTSNFIAFIC